MGSVVWQAVPTRFESGSPNAMLHMNKHSRPMLKWKLLQLRQLNVVVNVDVDGLLPMIPMLCMLLH